MRQHGEQQEGDDVGDGWCVGFKQEAFAIDVFATKVGEMLGNG